MLATVTSVLDWLGVIVFAITGALVASRKQMDIVGFILLGTVTGIGGGTLRDVLLGLTPVFWIREPAYLIVCVLTAGVVFFTAHLASSRRAVLLWLDAAGLALFAVAGAEIALSAGASPVVAVAMGVITATFGGIVRDILGAEIPIVLAREIYVTAALAGALAFVALIGLTVPRDGALVAGFALAFALRGAALRWSWSFPRYRPRAGED
jgi:uncharacterized membrane protein YeiH